jgi:uncharacterized protein YjbJ (UPF0337 family)
MGSKADRTKGTVKEVAGKVTRNRELGEKGRRQQIKADVKAGAKKAKDAAKKL